MKKKTIYAKGIYLLEIQYTTVSIHVTPLKQLKEKTN